MDTPRIAPTNSTVNEEPHQCSVCNYALRRSGRCSNRECSSRLNSKGPTVLSSDDLAKDAPPPLYHGRRWGSWTLDTERFCLVYDAKPVSRGQGSGVTEGVQPYIAFLGRYEIDIEQIRQSCQMLDWILQVGMKTWATARVTKDLINAFYSIFHPQQNLCSGGGNKVIKDPKAFLLHRIATVGGPLKDAA